MRSIRTAVALAAVALLAVLLSACGSSSSSTSTSSGGSEAVGTDGFQSPTTQSLDRQKGRHAAKSSRKRDFEHLDPGIAYYSVDYEVVFATQRPLYSNKPNTASEASPDMASGPPEISSDNKTVTVHLREGVKFSPPVNREVTGRRRRLRDPAWRPTRTSPTRTSMPTSNRSKASPKPTKTAARTRSRGSRRRTSTRSSSN